MKGEELFDKHLRGELTPAEKAELKRLLAQNPEAGRAFVEHVNETSLIVRVGSQIQSQENVVPLLSLEERVPGGGISAVDQNSGTRATRRSNLVKWGALAACCIGLAVVAVLLNRSRSLPPPRIAEVYVTGSGVQVTRAGALVSGDVIELKAGDLIAASTNQPAVIAYGHESTRIELQPGSAMVFGDAARGKRFDLLRGIIRARVAPQPAGQQMAIKTAHARATVIGTEFVMRADEHITRLDVLEGKVRLTCRTSGKKLTVKAGFSASVNPGVPLGIAPLCSSNCILRECIQSQKTKVSNEE